MNVFDQLIDTLKSVNSGPGIRDREFGMNLLSVIKMRMMH